MQREVTLSAQTRHSPVTWPSLAWRAVLARTVTHALVGLDARRVEVEAHLQLGVPGFAIVGLADRACQEAKERVRSGIASAELEWPVRRITVNLAPAELRKEGSGFDLPIALAVLAASRQVPPERSAGTRRSASSRSTGGCGRSAASLAAAEGARQAGLVASALRGRVRRRGRAGRRRARAGAPPGGGGRLPARRVAAASAGLARRLERNGSGPRGARPRRRARPGARAARARDRGRGRPQPAARRARPGRARRCSPAGCPGSCRRSRPTRRSRSRASTPSPGCSRRVSRS